MGYFKDLDHLLRLHGINPIVTRSCACWARLIITEFIPPRQVTAWCTNPRCEKHHTPIFWTLAPNGNLQSEGFTPVLLSPINKIRNDSNGILIHHTYFGIDKY